MARRIAWPHAPIDFYLWPWPAFPSNNRMTLSRVLWFVSRTIFLMESSIYTGSPTRLIRGLLRVTKHTYVNIGSRAGANYEQVGSFSTMMIRKTTLCTVSPSPDTLSRPLILRPEPVRLGDKNAAPPPHLGTPNRGSGPRS